MDILNLDNNHLTPIFEKVVFDKLGKKISQLKTIGAGSFGKVFKATLDDGSVLALKAYRIQGSQHGEADQLEILAKNTTVNMPKVFFVYEDDFSAILAMSFIEGKSAFNPFLLFKSKKRKHAFAEEVAKGMHEWHTVKGDKFGKLTSPSYDSWLDFYKTEKQVPWLDALKKLCDQGKYSKKKLCILEKATALFNSLPYTPTPPVITHCDLNVCNIMVNTKTLKLTGFIDPYEGLWADVEYDLYQLRNIGGEHFKLYKTYKNLYPMSKYTDFRVAYYAAMHESSMRLNGGVFFKYIEDVLFRRLKKELRRVQKILD